LRSLDRRRRGIGGPVEPFADPNLPLSKAERNGVALCLSGGGLRAALFHLGALRRLDELEILGRLWTISSVSGGTIAAAHLATRISWPVAGRTADWENRVAVPFRAFAREGARSRSILSRLFFRKSGSASEVAAMAEMFERRLTPLTRRHLPHLPHFVFPGLGPGESLARTVAAAVVSPGPILDHVAVEPVWGNHETLLVSDGGALFEPEAPMEREARALRKRWLIASYKTGALKGTYWGIEGARPRYDPSARLGYSKELVKRLLPAIRSTMDPISEAAVAVLENHGYLLADIAVQTHLPDLGARPPYTLTIPHTGWMDEIRVQEALGYNRWRLFGQS
jgi:NTE family protein